MLRLSTRVASWTRQWVHASASRHMSTRASPAIVSRFGAAAAAAAAGAATAATLVASGLASPGDVRAAESKRLSLFGDGQGHIIMSGDCGGTNSRLVLFRVPEGEKVEVGKVPRGEVLFQKKYLNSTFIERGEGFVEVCKVFLKEAGDIRPEACCLACAGGIVDNTVSFTNVKNGWTISGDKVSHATGIPRVRVSRACVAPHLHVSLAKFVACAPSPCLHAVRPLGCVLSATRACATSERGACRLR